MSEREPSGAAVKTEGIVRGSAVAGQTVAIEIAGYVNPLAGLAGEELRAGDTAIFEREHFGTGAWFLKRRFPSEAKEKE